MIRGTKIKTFFWDEMVLPGPVGPVGQQGPVGPVGQQGPVGPPGIGGMVWINPKKPSRQTFDHMMYKNFLRLNDRRKSQTEEDLKRAKYPSQTVGFEKNIHEIIAWCDETMPNRYVWFEDHDVNFFPDIHFYFENENDRLLFAMRWA